MTIEDYKRAETLTAHWAQCRGSRQTAEYRALCDGSGCGVRAQLGGDRLAAGGLLAVTAPPAQIKENPMINCPEGLRAAEHWANRFLVRYEHHRVRAIALAHVPEERQSDR